MLKNKEELEYSLNKDPVLGEVFKLFPNLYLVGGFIRDMYLERENPDRDFIVPDDLSEIANKLSQYYNLTKVILKDNLTIRLVFKDKKAFIDLTKMRGALKDDLKGRDFTINSVAYNPEEGIIDPLNGLEDLEYGLIRCVREGNLIDDPLRMLRAYRFLSELNCDIEERTRQWITKNSSHLKEVASERITLEIIKMLNAEHSFRALQMALKDGILDEVFSFNKGKLEFIIKNISLFYKKLKESPEDVRNTFNEQIDMGLSLKGLMVLELFTQFSDIKHWRLSLSKRIKTRLGGFIHSKDRARCLLRGLKGKELYDCFRQLYGNLFEFIFFLGKWELLPEMKRFYRVNKNPIVDGEFIKKHLGLDEGPEIGRIVEALKREEFLGGIKTVEDAKEFLNGLKGN